MCGAHGGRHRLVQHRRLGRRRTSTRGTRDLNGSRTAILFGIQNTHLMGLTWEGVTNDLDCRWDYHNFCGEYGIGSPLLNYCFRNNGAKLSRACVNALIQAGDVSKNYVQARRRAGH
jgi:hypothetical protein